MQNANGGDYNMMGLEDEELGVSANLASDANVYHGRAHTEFNSPPDYGISTSSMNQGKNNVVNSMQERNR